ncbi:sodium channel protein Nach-like isoform X2 [Plodia interpunctella]|uniref:sodium channel protein Nach-like isoform X2 n=1 Tax=Plodia interpunctella TaxID=58824 RepID=UPI002367E43F|nr:sodium channel protein Nach-like isoform X2 [Plodia interpunctella]
MNTGYRNLLRRFCLETSISGLKYFYIYPDRVSRCFWAITMLTMMYVSCILTWLLYNRFTEIPTRITIENQYEPLEGMPFPAITLCSPNQITISSMMHFNRTLVDGNLTLDLEKVLPRLQGFYAPLFLEENDTLDRLQSLIEINRYTITEVMYSLPQRCEDFLRMCVMGLRVYPNCRGLMRPVLTAHGLCCIFNSVYHFRNNHRNEKDPSLVTWKVKSMSSIILGTLTVVTDYSPTDALDRSILNAGSVRVMFNDPYEFPSDDEMKMLQPQSQTFHVIHATYTYCSEEVQQLPSWSRKCYFQDEYKQRFFGDYHNSDCDLLCSVMAVEKECKCLLFYVPYVFASRACNVSSIPCILKVKLHMYHYVSPEECECPRDCDHRRYRIDSTIGNLRGLNYIYNYPYKSGRCVRAVYGLQCNQRPRDFVLLVHRDQKLFSSPKAISCLSSY